MQSFNYAHFAKLAKRASGNALFRIDTLRRLSSTALIFLAVACLAAALPTALLTQKRESVRVDPYLEFQVKPANGKLLQSRPGEALHPAR